MECGAEVDIEVCNLGGDATVKPADIEALRSGHEDCCFSVDDCRDEMQGLHDRTLARIVFAHDNGVGLERDGMVAKASIVL